MEEFIRTEEKVVNVGEPVIFENNTNSDFSVSAAIVFRKSGLYDVSIVGRRTIISKVAERKIGKWIWKDKKKYCPGDYWWPPTGHEDTWNEEEGTWIDKELYCSECNYENWRHNWSNFCPNCGASMMEGKEHETDY